MVEGRYGDAFTRPAWPGAIEGTGNYRPLMLSSFAAEWSLWGDRPAGFHAVSVAAHGLVSLLVLLLLTSLVPLESATVGALIFAAHPVHTEAVANVVGRAELYAALAYLGACLVYLAPRPARPTAVAGRLLALLALALLALGSKEIAVTLPGMLVLLEAYRRDPAPLSVRLRSESATYVAVGGAVAIYVLVRWSVLGDLTGESPSAGLRSLDHAERVLTGLTVWPHYLRLMVFPLDLAAEYGPATFTPARAVTRAVLLGASLLAAALAASVLLRARAPVIALGVAWFVLAALPVSNLIVRSDILLAERTLYLPSVGLAIVAAALWGRAAVRGRRARLAVLGLLSLFVLRTIDRNPSWADTGVALRTLAVEHPESWLAYRTRATTLQENGAPERAAELLDSAVALAPDHYQLLLDASMSYETLGRLARADELVRRAIELEPRYLGGHRVLAERRLAHGDGRGAHRAALHGIEVTGGHASLWYLISESYVLKGDLEAAVRARRAGIGQAAPPTPAAWTRLAELLDALDRTELAEEARRSARRLEPAVRGGV